MNMTWGLTAGSWIAPNWEKRGLLLNEGFFFSLFALIHIQKNPDVVCYLNWSEDQDLLFENPSEN